MRDFLKNKVATVLIVVATVILAGIAIFTAVRLYQLRTKPVAPTAPESRPEAGGPTPTPEACRELAFNIHIPSPTPQATTTPTPTSEPSPTPTSTATPTPTEPPRGGDPSPTPIPTVTPEATTTPVPTVTGAPISTPTPTEAPTLPDAGVGLPTIMFGALGMLLIFLSLMLAF